MLTEALRTGKPVDVYQLPTRSWLRLSLRHWPLSLLIRTGLLSAPRDVTSLVAQLIENNHVGVVGEQNAIRKPFPSWDDQVVELVKVLLAKG